MMLVNNPLLRPDFLGGLRFPWFLGRFLGILVEQLIKPSRSKPFQKWQWGWQEVFKTDVDTWKWTQIFLFGNMWKHFIFRFQLQKRRSCLRPKKHKNMFSYFFHGSTCHLPQCLDNGDPFWLEPCGWKMVKVSQNYANQWRIGESWVFLAG